MGRPRLLFLDRFSFLSHSQGCSGNTAPATARKITGVRLMIAAFAFLGSLLASSYLILVSFCVCHRMTPQTSHAVRAVVMAIGGTGMWAIGKSCEMAGQMTAEDLQFSVGIILCAVVVGMVPRFPTGKVSAVERSRISG